MGGVRVTEWRKLPMNLAELCIDTTLRCGQSFRWKKSESGEWICAIHGRILTLRQDSTHLHYKAVFPSKSTQAITPPPSSPSSTTSAADGTEDDTEALIHHYFNLTPNLTKLYEQWSAADANFKKKAPKFTGVRILKQDAWEALVGFICSSNNNIARISQMVHKLCINYGPLIGHIDDQPYHDFPTPQALAKPDVEAKLRALGFGYRAKYLYQTACIVANEKEPGWLDGLRNPESPVIGKKPKSAGPMQEGGRTGYREAHEALLELQGVGPKVADCVSLMGLGWGEAVPVDTHVWQIAVRDYRFGKGKHSSLTKATYDAVANKFRGLWGKEAGWAHSVLFTADLKAFSERLIAKVEQTEVTMKVEPDSDEGKENVVQTVKRKKIVEKEIKRETDLEPRKEVAIQEDMMSRVKRRRAK